jgi:hypothetical protein
MRQKGTLTQRGVDDTVLYIVLSSFGVRGLEVFRAFLGPLKLERQTRGDDNSSLQFFVVECKLLTTISSVLVTFT